jgi:protoheme IX farnesyltransferase
VLQEAPFTLRQRLAGYVALTKPRIIELLLITTVPTQIVAARGMPDFWLMFNTVLGGTLAAGGANAINMYVDRDIDKVMERTKGRPLVTGVVTRGPPWYSRWRSRSWRSPGCGTGSTC